MSSSFQAGRRSAFVDTGAYFALADSRDVNHLIADAIHSRLVTERWRLRTSNLVVAEAHALLLNRLGYQIAVQFLDQLKASSTVLERVTLADEERAGRSSKHTTTSASRTRTPRASP